jgi:hypothetical protein
MSDAGYKMGIPPCWLVLENYWKNSNVFSQNPEYLVLTSIYVWNLKFQKHKAFDL